MSSERPMRERICDPDVVEWAKDRRLSDGATERCRQIIAAWRREQRDEQAQTG